MIRNTRPITREDKAIAANLRAARLKSGKTLEEIADAMGMTRAMIRNYERGKSRIGAGLLVRLAKVLDVAPRAFFKGVR